MKGIVECSNEVYHGEKEHLSSSNLKLLLKNPQDFYSEKILGNKKEVSSSTQANFDEGSYAHTLILEPDNTDEYKIFSGLQKKGEEWEKFKIANPDKILLSKSQKIKVEKWVQTYGELPEAVSLIKNGKPELSLFGELLDVPIKVRADYINIDEGYIVDVKTTSSPTDVDNFKYTIESFGYDLSAALYLKMFELHYGKKFDFYFLVLGKREATCDIYKLSDKTRAIGDSKIIKALSIYKKCKKSGIWVLEKDVKNDKIDSGYEILEV